MPHSHLPTNQRPRHPQRLRSIDKQIDKFQASAPGASFKTKEVKAHHSFGKVEWEAVDANEKTVVAGWMFLIVLRMDALRGRLRF